MPAIGRFGGGAVAYRIREAAQRPAATGYEAFQGWRRGLVRNSAAGELLELFLVAAVASVLAIRAFLAATGYPQLGGDGLHIAHMLWGGGLMLVALLLLFAFLSRPLARLAAITGGIGFGTFIDELGKFITADNDYFYAPTIGLIYVIFVAIFLALRAVRRVRTYSPPDALVNALAQIGDNVSAPLSAAQKRELLALLAQSDQAHPLLPHLRAYVEGMEGRAPDETHWYFRLKDRALGAYARIAAARWFAALFPVVFFLWGLVQVVWAVWLVYGFFDATTADDFRWYHYAQAGAMVVSGVCVVIGFWRWYGHADRAGGYRWYIRSTLVSIFITQVAIFLNSQLAALSGLSVNVLAYVTLAILANLEAGTPHPGDAPG